MNCPECQHEMTQSKSGWLCLNCGHSEAIKPSETSVIPGDGAAASSGNATAAVVLENRKRGKKEDASTAIPSPADQSVKEVRSEPAAAETPAEVPSEVAPVTPPPDEPKLDEQPAPEPPAEASVPAETPAPEPPNEPTLAELSSEDHNLQHPAAPMLPPVPVWAESAAPASPVAAAAPAATDAKAPLTPKTHPGSSGGKIAPFVVGGFILVAVLIGAYYGFLSPQRPLASVLHLGGTPTPVIATTDLAPSISPTSSASPVASTTPGADPATNDAQRKVDLTTYAQAYKTAATNGYYNTKPPTVKSDATDPSTGQVYQIISTPPTAVGQIYYWAGGQCGGAGVTPGKTSTKYLALEMKLESTTELYCVDVK